ncbi:MAG: MBOAT family O-acyltransferase, partial [Myxococcota bacterium]|nr:MBOAT family O-acyltransferase [Myxococcota bacterium]
MTFIQSEFLWLFAGVLAVYWLAFGRSRTLQNVLLVAVSFVFYGWVHPWFCLLLAFSAVLDFHVGGWMGRPDEQPRGRRRWLLALSMAGNLGMLGYFKYAGFFVENVAAVLTAMGMQANEPSLQVILPVGISFYTFQTMSYTIDIYRGELRARTNFLEYMVFVSFFPQLVAGPVERASRLLPQVEADRVFRSRGFWSGLGLALWGGFKKMVVADTIAPYADAVFVHTEPSFAMVAAATLGFAIQILADFSGYTDIARGTARMLGFNLVLNFDHPYLAVNPSDFWKRWHISFSSWIRDYLYIPLGGSRGSRWTTHGATFGAMLLSGLWHGASWTFVLWGLYHAVLITGYRTVSRWIPREFRKGRVGRTLAVPLMFLFTCAGWLIFRETHIDRLVHYLTLPVLGGTSDQWMAATILLGMCLDVSLPLIVGLLIEKLVIPHVRAT